MPTINKGKKNKPRTGDQYDAARRRIYNSDRWRKLRRYKFQINPLCERCLAKGKITPAEDIHHRMSFMQTDNPEIRYHLAYDIENLESLCKQCHAEEHKREMKN